MTGDFSFVMICDDGYLPFAAVTAKRVVELSGESSAPVFFLVDNPQERDLAMAKEYVGERLNVVCIDALLNDLAVPSARAGRAIYGPLILDLVGALRDLRRCLFLDADVLPMTDLAAIAGIPHKKSSLAACHDLRNTANDDFHERLGMPPGSPYFNSGVMWIDLDWASESGKFAEARRFLAEHPEACRLHDQDALNRAYLNDWQVLDWRWNVQADLFARSQIRQGAGIIHFSGVKPWRRPNEFFPVEVSEAYLSLLAASPWRDRYRRSYSAADRFRWLAGVKGRDMRDYLLRRSLLIARNRQACRFVRRRRLLRNASPVMTRISGNASSFEAAKSLADLIN